MNRNPFYLPYALALFSLAGMAQYRGWSLMSVDQVKNVPKTVRDNPGVYRSIYRSSPHYFGGK